jgi:hypothetical protein
MLNITFSNALTLKIFIKILYKLLFKVLKSASEALISIC